MSSRVGQCKYNCSKWEKEKIAGHMYKLFEKDSLKLFFGDCDESETQNTLSANSKEPFPLIIVPLTFCIFIKVKDIGVP